MHLKSYRARTMQEAIELVRRDLGPDAAVLHTREVRRAVLVRWFARRQVEVTASREINIPSRFARSSPPESEEEQPTLARRLAQG